VTVLVNGKAGPGEISPLERGLHFGDGVFETIACRNGRPRFLQLHLLRLALGCDRLRIQQPDPHSVADDVLKLAREGGDAIVKLLVTRGVATARGYATSNESATRIAIRYPWPHEDPSQARDGVRVCTLPMRLGENPLLAGLKHCNRLEQILARSMWPEDDTSEGILFSSSGNLVSGTAANVFTVRDGTLLTPRIDRCGVAGVMRQVVLREAERAGIAAQERTLDAQDLLLAQEVFLTNARIGIWPVRELDARMRTPGPVTRRLQAILAPLLEEPGDDFRL
jgi:4-amino-4-deoxychorismate lyase